MPPVYLFYFVLILLDSLILTNLNIVFRSPGKLSSHVVPNKKARIINRHQAGLDPEHLFPDYLEIN